MGVGVGGCGTSVSVAVDVGERGVSLAGTDVLVGVKVDGGGIGVAQGVAEVGSGVAVGRTDPAVSLVVPQATSCNAQSKRLNRCRFMATPLSKRPLSAVRAVYDQLTGVQAGLNFPAAVDQPNLLLSSNNPLSIAGVQGTVIW